MRLLYEAASPRPGLSLPFTLTVVFGRTCLRKNRRRASKRVVASIHSFAGRLRSLALHEKAGKVETVSAKKLAKSATIAVYWVGPALGAVLGLGIFKTAYKGESKKKSKRKTR